MTASTAVALPMGEFLAAVAYYRTDVPEALQARGVHPNVIQAKADLALRRQYVDCGVANWRCWLTHQGRLFVLPHLTVVRVDGRAQCPECWKPYEVPKAHGREWFGDLVVSRSCRPMEWLKL